MATEISFLITLIQSCLLLYDDKSGFKVAESRRRIFATFKTDARSARLKHSRPPTQLDKILQRE